MNNRCNNSEAHTTASNFQLHLAMCLFRRVQASAEQCSSVMRALIQTSGQVVGTYRISSKTASMLVLVPHCIALTSATCVIATVDKID